MISIAKQVTKVTKTKVTANNHPAEARSITNQPASAKAKVMNRGTATASVRNKAADKEIRAAKSVRYFLLLSAFSVEISDRRSGISTLFFYYDLLLRRASLADRKSQSEI